MKSLLIGLVLGMTCLSTLHAQSLGDVAAAQAAKRGAAHPAEVVQVTQKVYTDKDVKRFTVEPVVTPAEAADIDRSKFDQVYATGKAVDTAWTADATRQQVQAFKTAMAIAADHVTTKAEKKLLNHYFLALTYFEIGVRELNRAGNKKEIDEAFADLNKAKEDLNAANQVYLGK